MPPLAIHAYTATTALGRGREVQADAQELQSSLGPHIGRFAGATYTLNKVAEKTRLCGALADRQRESARQFFHKADAQPRGPARDSKALH